MNIKHLTEKMKMPEFLRENSYKFDCVNVETSNFTFYMHGDSCIMATQDSFNEFISYMKENGMILSEFDEVDNTQIYVPLSSRKYMIKFSIADKLLKSANYILSELIKHNEGMMQ